MNLSKYKLKMGETLKTNTAILGVAVALAVSNIILVNKLSEQHERIVIVPPTLKDQASVSWRAASLEYKKAFATYVSGLIGNITPSNVDFIVESLSRFFEPQIYGEVRKRLIEISKDPFFKSSGAYSYFVPVRIIYEPETDKIFVIGDLTTGNSVVRPKKKSVVYEMKVAIRGGIPKIESLEVYEGTEPHTIEWRKRHEQKS